MKEVFEQIAATLKGGDDVSVTGFGRFYTTLIPSRSYKTPSGESGVSAEKRIAKFLSGEKLRKYLEDE